MRPGEIISDRYRVDRLAGEGGMGAVYRAIDLTTGTPGALKVLHRDRARLAEGFERESRVLGELRDAVIVSYLAHGVTKDGDLWLALEWLEGEDLATRLDRKPLEINET